MNKLICLLLLAFLPACASSPQKNSFAAPAIQPGNDCSQRHFEVFWLSQILSEKEKWFFTNQKSYSSSVESIVGELQGHLRYNAMFLRTEPRDESGWTFYAPFTPPRRNQHNLFTSLLREDNDLLKGDRRRVWIDSRYRTLEFTEADLARVCPNCVAGKDFFKVAIVAKFPNGRIDLWTLNQAGALENATNGCKGK